MPRLNHDWHKGYVTVITPNSDSVVFCNQVCTLVKETQKISLKTLSRVRLASGVSGTVISSPTNLFLIQNYKIQLSQLLTLPSQCCPTQQHHLVIHKTIRHLHETVKTLKMFYHRLVHTMMILIILQTLCCWFEYQNVSSISETILLYILSKQRFKSH